MEQEREQEKRGAGTELAEGETPRVGPATPQETSPQETAAEETAPQETTAEETASQETAAQETAPQETTDQETSPQEITAEETTPQETSPQETAPEETASQETSPQETAAEESTSQETTSQETSTQETTAEETDKGDGLRWYILQSYSNFERQVVETIKVHAKQSGLEDAFGEMIVPTERVVEVRRGKRVQSERKIFPGYVLVKMRMTAASHNLVKNLSKVMGFLGYDNAEMPNPVSDAEIAAIIHQVKEGLTATKPSITFEVGEQVRVSEGPFASFNGLVEEVDEDKARLKVAVSIFGRSTPVELSYAQVEKV